MTDSLLTRLLQDLRAAGAAAGVRSKMAGKLSSGATYHLGRQTGFEEGARMVEALLDEASMLAPEGPRTFGDLSDAELHRIAADEHENPGGAATAQAVLRGRGQTATRRAS